MTHAPEGALVVFCTVPDAKCARELARSMVERALAACVNVIPALTSYYEWKGALHEDEELLLVIKTSRARLPSLERWLLDAHPYDVPELLALPVAHGTPEYLRWLFERLEPAKGPSR